MTPVYTHFLWTYFGLSFQFHSNERTNSPVADIIRLDSQERYIPTYILEPARKIWSEVAISQRNPSVIKSSSPLYLYIVYPYSLSLCPANTYLHMHLYFLQDFFIDSQLRCSIGNFGRRITTISLKKEADFDFPAPGRSLNWGFIELSIVC